MARRKFLMGNWKMNKTAAEAKEFAVAAKDLAKLAKANKVDIGVAPTYMSLAVTRKSAAKSMIVAAQNVHFNDHGAFTGEVSIPMLKEFKIDWVILGHSERRAYDNETSEKCNAKMKAMVEAGMTPIYCVGETLEQFEAGDTKKVVRDQILKGFEGLSAEQTKKFVVAYEPVWSIGTGKNASVEIADDVCKYIRKVLREVVGGSANKIRILYGGSVKPENIKAYLGCPNVDGALVGGASLKIDSFKELLTNIL